jgi:hypothetical protein
MVFFRKVRGYAEFISRPVTINHSGSARVVTLKNRVAQQPVWSSGDMGI